MSLVPKCFFLFLLILAPFSWGCTRERLSAQTDYITVETLASYFVDTPDPRKFCPNQGQRLTITWSLPKEYNDYQDLHLELVVRFRNRNEDKLDIPIEKATGVYYYKILNEDYFSTGGILTYKITLVGSNQTLEEWKHQLWWEQINTTLEVRD